MKSALLHRLVISSAVLSFVLSVRAETGDSDTISIADVTTLPLGHGFHIRRMAEMRNAADFKRDNEGHLLKPKLSPTSSSMDARIYFEHASWSASKASGTKIEARLNAFLLH